MAIIFELWTECKDEQAASQFAQHFEGIKYLLSTGREIHVTTEAVTQFPELFSVIVTPSGLSRYGIRTLQDAIETTEVGLQLYFHLRSAPDFRYARIDWEAGNIPMSDLPDFVETINDGKKRIQIECVVDNALYEEIGKPKFCYPFRNGYWWTRYSGETYKPLGSGDQSSHTGLHRKLFPEHFKY